MNEFLKKLRNEEPTVGTWLQIGSVISTEVIASAYFDWICVDLEHGIINIETMANMFMAIEKGGSVPVARVPSADPTMIHRVLDSGAKAIIIPMILNEIQCRNAINASKYPPQGHRGFGYCRANSYGKWFDLYSRSANDDIAIIIQIEHIVAINNLWPILQTEGIDATFIGPYDLSGSLGESGNFQNPKYLCAIEKYLDMSKQANVPTGIHIVCPNHERIKEAINKGYTMIAVGMDTVFLQERAMYYGDIFDSILYDKKNEEKNNEL